MSPAACLFALAGLILLFYLMSLPFRPPIRLILSTLGGYACLVLVNLFSFLTGAVFSLNIVTAVIVGFLGLPGLGLLFALRLLLPV